jgi:hypothetical protein
VQSNDNYSVLNFTQREELRLRVFEDRVLKIIFRPKRVEVAGERIMMGVITCTLNQILLG